MRNFFNGLFILFIIAYVLSPIDCVPGPVDDLILMLVGYTVEQKRRAC